MADLFLIPYFFLFIPIVTTIVFLVLWVLERFIKVKEIIYPIEFTNKNFKGTQEQLSFVLKSQFEVKTHYHLQKGMSGSEMHYRIIIRSLPEHNGELVMKEEIEGLEKQVKMKNFYQGQYEMMEGKK